MSVETVRQQAMSQWCVSPPVSTAILHTQITYSLDRANIANIFAKFCPRRIFAFANMPTQKKRTFEKNKGPQYEQRLYSTRNHCDGSRGSGIGTSSCCSVAPAGCCPTYCLGQTDGLIVSGANVSSFHWQLNAYRSQ